MHTQPPTRLKTLFHESVEDSLLEGCVRVVFTGYRTVRQVCVEMFGSTGSPESHDALPHIRRGLIEQDLRATADRHDGVSAGVALNKGDNCNHTEIVSGRVLMTQSAVKSHTEIVSGRVLMTQSAVKSHTEIVRLARFRQGYAEAYQLGLGLDGESVERDKPQPDAPLYAIIIHGPDPENLSLPAFVHVVFPSRDCSHYVDRIDLLERFSDLAAALRSDVETIPEPSPSLRPDVRHERLHGEASV